MGRMARTSVPLATMAMFAMSVPSAGAEPDTIRRDWMQQDGRKAGAGDEDAYLESCRLRRRKRLKRLLESVPAIVFLENTEFGNAPRLNMSLSDGPYDGKPFRAGAAIRILKFGATGEAVVTDLLRDPGGMIRDLDVSFDGKRVLFSWKKSRGDDFHLYEMVAATRTVRQVTRERGVADIQGRYLSTNRLLYHSTRCVNVVDCNESIDVVNLYTCDLDGGNITRLAFDQVSTQYPSVLPDGRIVYTRWDYNDRGQIYPQGLFTMNPDGTQQRAFYGNNSWYPTSLLQARAMPGTQTLLAIASGHHTPPCGKLVTVDVSKGTEEGKGILLLAPERKPKPKRVDKAEQDGALFQYPYPLTKDDYLTGFSLLGKKRSSHFAIYWMNRAGERELLAWDPEKPYRHPLPLVSRAIPPERPSTVDPEKDHGTFYVDDIYGTIKRLRVIGLEFRAAAVGRSHNRGEGGRARVCTPVSLSGAWDVKRVLGEAKVYEDGSAFFHAPSRLAVYFQAIDGKGHAVQSMRSWATLQPGESFSCMGCHEGKGYAPSVTARTSQAMRSGPQELEAFHGPARGFSFLREVQPILDKHCVECHKGRVYTPGFKGSGKESFSLTREPVRDAEAKRAWTESYVSLLQAAKSKGGKGVN
ncbi:MAG: HzsA-related protein, partial [Planctomycetota bacterium]